MGTDSMKKNSNATKFRKKALQGLPCWDAGDREDSENFYQNLSHVLRTPLIGMRGYVEYLLCGYTGNLNQEQTKCLARARESSIKLENHIEVLMDLLAFQMKLIPDKTEASPFGPLWEGWVEILRGISKAHGNSLKVDANHPEAWIRADHKWLKAFWVKFFESLCDTLPSRKTIQIRTEKKGARVTVVLSGRWGVSWDLLKHWGSAGLLGVHMDDRIKRVNVFQFALAREILIFHGGELKIRASNENAGTGEIYVGFPCAPDPAKMKIIAGVSSQGV